MQPAALHNDGSFASRNQPNATYVCTSYGKMGGRLVMTFRGRDNRGRDAKVQADEFRSENEHFGHVVSIEVVS